MKRFRPRFSIRTLVVVVTLVCCYAACWGPTKRRGVEAVKAKPSTTDVNPIAPLLLAANEGNWIDVGDQREILIRLHANRTYYFWFFGFIVKLPYEREIENNAIVWPTMRPPPPGSSPESP
jgi:hypothetical protein